MVSYAAHVAGDTEHDNCSSRLSGPLGGARACARHGTAMLPGVEEGLVAKYTDCSRVGFSKSPPGARGSAGLCEVAPWGLRGRCRWDDVDKRRRVREMLDGFSHIMIMGPSEDCILLIFSRILRDD